MEKNKFIFLHSCAGHSLASTDKFHLGACVYSNRVGKVASPTRAPGTRQPTLTYFLWVPVCIKKPVNL